MHDEIYENIVDKRGIIKLPESCNIFPGDKVFFVDIVCTDSHIYLLVKSDIYLSMISRIKNLNISPIEKLKMTRIYYSSIKDEQICDENGCVKLNDSFKNSKILITTNGKKALIKKF